MSERVSGRNRAENHKSGFDRTIFQPPEGVQIFQIKAAGVRRFDILAYRVGRGNPFADPGKLHFERTFFNHRGIGVSDDSYICRAKTFSAPCPICEHRAVLAKQPDQGDLVKSLAPKERQLFWVFDHGEPAKAFQIFEYSFFNFGKQLDARIKGSDREDGYEFFADPVDGFTLRVNFDEQSMGSGKFFQATSIDFKKREKPYTVADCDKLPCLDSLLIDLGYDRLKAIFLQTEDDRQDAAGAGGGAATGGPAPAAATGHAPETGATPAPPTAGHRYKPGDRVDHPAHGSGCEVLTVSSDGETLKIEDKNGDAKKGIDVKEVTQHVPAPAPAPVTTAPAAGYKVEDKVTHPAHGACIVARVKDGRLVLEDGRGEFHKDVDPATVTAGHTAPPATAAPAAARPLAVGDTVDHIKWGRSSVIRVDGDGTVVLEDKGGDFRKGVKPADCEVVAGGAGTGGVASAPAAKQEAPKTPPTTPTAAPSPAAAGGTGEWDDWDDKK